MKCEIKKKNQQLYLKKSAKKQDKKYNKRNYQKNKRKKQKHLLFLKEKQIPTKKNL